MNIIVITGRLTKDPETRTTSTGKNVASFTVAVDKQFPPQDGGPTADFFDVSCWSKQAEYVENYGKKGRLVAVEGRMESRQYTDKNDQKRTVWQITASNVSFLDRGDSQSGDKQAAKGQASVNAQSPIEDPFAE